MKRVHKSGEGSRRKKASNLLRCLCEALGFTDKRMLRHKGASLLGTIILLLFWPLAAWGIHSYIGNLTISVIGGFLAVPTVIWFFTLIFNNPIALRFQNYPGNHDCPSCKNRFKEYRSQPNENGNITIECLKCGNKNIFDSRYNHLDTSHEQEKT